MPTDNHGKSYTYLGSGTNSQVSIISLVTRGRLTLIQGNHYCTRDYGSDAPNQNSYHYSNQSVSYMI